MNNFQLLRTRDIGAEMHCEAQAAMFDGAATYTYVVVNPAWNKRLLDRSSHRAFEKYMQEELDVTCIQSITQGLKSDRFYFLALSF